MWAEVVCSLKCVIGAQTKISILPPNNVQQTEQTTHLGHAQEARSAKAPPATMRLDSLTRKKGASQHLSHLQPSAAHQGCSRLVQEEGGALLRLI